MLTCKFEDDLIKSEGAMLRTTFSPLQVYGKISHRPRASNSEVNSLIWLEIELVRDFKAVLVTCKFEEDPIKNEVAIPRKTFFLLLVHGSHWLQWKQGF